MSKKQDYYYFQNLMECADEACRAAHLLQETMREFHQDELPDKLQRMHEVEHAGDVKKHEMMNVLARAFITPLDREDIVHVSQNLDEVTDKIEDVLIKMYYNRIQSIRPDALDMADVVCRCCDEVARMMREFADFRKSKTLKDHVIAINTLEEEADELFIACMYRLHDTCQDPLEVITWREIYMYLEKCADACEHVADVVESTVMKNI